MTNTWCLHLTPKGLVGNSESFLPSAEFRNSISFPLNDPLFYCWKCISRSAAVCTHGFISSHHLDQRQPFMHNKHVISFQILCNSDNAVSFLLPVEKGNPHSNDAALWEVEVRQFINSVKTCETSVTISSLCKCADVGHVVCWSSHKTLAEVLVLSYLNDADLTLRLMSGPPIRTKNTENAFHLPTKHARLCHTPPIACL